MHTYMITRGIKHEVDQFITELQGKYLPFKFRDPAKPGSKELVDTYVQLGVRPIQLWEIVFPEDSKDLVLATLFGPDHQTQGQHEKHKKYIKMLRFALGIKEPGKYDSSKLMPIRRQGVETICVGIKEDYWVDKNDKVINKKEEGAYEGL